ncbi:MAG: hypothetical protein ACTHL1_06305 [Burkholderiaceae bacterium]
MARAALSVRRRRLVGGLVAAIGAGAGYSLQAAVPKLIHAPVSPPLHRGLNLTHALEDGPDQAAARRFQALRHAGFDHVRLSLDPAALGWRPDAPPGAPVFAAVGPLDAALDALRAAGLTVLLGLCPGPEASAYLKAHPERMEAALTRALGFLAGRYRGYGEHGICFETVAKPDRFCAADDWSAMQGRLLRAMRVQAPRHWLIAGGAWDPVSPLRTIDPYPDQRVLYGFPFFKPYPVTRRGTEREPAAAPASPYPEGIPYPSDLLDLDRLPATSRSGDVEVRARLAAYKNENWNLGRVRREIAFPADWAAENHVPVLCTETGALPDRIDPASRLRWLSDATRALDERSIPWTLSDAAPLDAGTAGALHLRG